MPRAWQAGAWVGASVLLLGLVACGGAPRPDAAILIVLDTLRADRISAYRSARKTTPALDAMAQRGVLFENAVSYSSWTLPAMVALLAGAYPSAAIYQRSLKRSLAEALDAAGFRTAAVTEGGYVSAHFGLDRGFRFYHEEEGAVRLLTRRPGEETGSGGGIEHTFQAARTWLDENAGHPFFLLIHTYEVHTPYRRPPYTQAVPRGALGETLELSDVARIRRGEIEVGKTEIAYVKELYDGGVVAADRHVGRFLDWLAAQPIGARTLVVVTSDHGEELGERHPRWAGDHGHTLYDELLRIPLILYNPVERYPVSRVVSQVSIIDVMPTILDLLGVPSVPETEGRSLRPLLRGAQDPQQPALARLYAQRPGTSDAARTAMRYAGYKLVFSRPFALPATPSIELFDLEADPQERNNLADRDSEPKLLLQTALRETLKRLEQAGPPDFQDPAVADEALRRRLESLGYVQ